MYKFSAMQHWRRLDMHLASLERVLALLKAGRSIEARIAIIAITTNNSMSVNAVLLFLNAFNIRDCTIECAFCHGRSHQENYSLGFARPFVGRFPAASMSAW